MIPLHFIAGFFDHFSYSGWWAMRALPMLPVESRWRPDFELWLNAFELVRGREAVVGSGELR